MIRRRLLSPELLFPFLGLLIMLPLIYIDEGNYSFSGFLTLSNVVALGMYLGFIAAVQWLIYLLLFKIGNIQLRSLSASLLFIAVLSAIGFGLYYF